MNESCFVAVLLVYSCCIGMLSVVLYLTHALAYQDDQAALILASLYGRTSSAEYLLRAEADIVKPGKARSAATLLV